MICATRKLTLLLVVSCACLLLDVLPQTVAGQQYIAPSNLTLSGINFSQPVVIVDPNGTLIITNCTFQAALTVKRSTTAVTPRPMNFSLSSSALRSTLTLDGFSTNGSRSLVVLQDNNISGSFSSTSLSFKSSAQFWLLRNRFFDTVTLATHNYDTSATLLMASNLYVGKVTLSGSSFFGMSSLIIQANDFRVQLGWFNVYLKSTSVLVEYNSIVALTSGCCTEAGAFMIGGSGSWTASNVTFRHNNITAVQDGTSAAYGLSVSITTTTDGQSIVTLLNNSIRALNRATSLGPLVPADAIYWRGVIRGGAYFTMPIEDYSLRTVGNVRWCLREYPWPFNLSGIVNPQMGLALDCPLGNDLIIANSTLDFIDVSQLYLDGNEIQVTNVNLTSLLSFVSNDFRNVDFQIAQLRAGSSIYLISSAVIASNLSVVGCTLGGTMQLGSLDFVRGTNVTIQRNRIRNQFNWICTYTSNNANLFIEGNDIYGYTYSFQSDAIALRIDGGSCDSCTVTLRNNNVTGEQGSSGGAYGIWVSSSMKLRRNSRLVLSNNTVAARRFVSTSTTPVSAEAIAWFGSLETGTVFQMADDDYSSSKLFGSVRWHVDSGYPRDLVFNGIQNPINGGIYIDGSVGASITFRCCSLGFISITGMEVGSGETLRISDTNTTNGITLSSATFGANSTLSLRRVAPTTFTVISTIFNQSMFTARKLFVSGRIVFNAVKFVSQTVYDNRFQTALGGESWIGVTLDSNVTVTYTSSYWFSHGSSCCKPVVAFSRSASSLVTGDARLTFSASSFVASNTYSGGPAIAFLSDSTSIIDQGALKLACTTLNSSTGAGASTAPGTALEITGGFHPVDGLQLADWSSYSGDVKLTLTPGMMAESNPFVLRNVTNPNLRLFINGTSSVDVLIIGLELLALNISLSLEEGRNLTISDCGFSQSLVVNATNVVRSQVSITDTSAYAITVSGQLASDSVLLIDGLNVTNSIAVRHLWLDSRSAATISNCAVGQGLIVDSVIVDGSSTFRLSRSNFSRSLNSCCSTGFAVDFRTVQFLNPSSLIIEENNVTCVNYYSSGACGGINFGANARLESYLRVDGNSVSSHSGNFDPQPGIYIDRTYPTAEVQLRGNILSLGTIQVERLSSTFFNMAENTIVTGTIAKPGRLSFQGTGSDSAVRLRCNSDQNGPLSAYGTYPTGVEDVRSCGSACRAEIDCYGRLSSSVSGNSPSENCVCACSYGGLSPRCDQLIRGIAPFIPAPQSPLNTCPDLVQSPSLPIAFPVQQCPFEQCTITQDCNDHARNVTAERIDGELNCHCECLAGFAGDSCETCAGNYSGYPSCTPSPCSNVSDCSNRAAFVSGLVATGCTCQCLPSWAGQQCQCAMNFAGTRCERCATGYEQYPNCSLIPGACTNANCSNHADDVTGLSPNCTCQCQKGFNGSSCQRCAPNYEGYPICRLRACNVSSDCSRHGAIAVRGSLDTGCFCDCKSGYSGSTCAVQLALNTSRSQPTRTVTNLTRSGGLPNLRHTHLQDLRSSSLSETISSSMAVSVHQRFQELGSAGKRNSQPTVLGSTAVAKAIANSGTAFAVASSFVGSPAIAGQAIRARAILHATQCAWVDTDLEPSYFEQPLQFSLGNHSLKLYVGATVLSTGVLVLFPWLVLIIAWLALNCSNDKSTEQGLSAERPPRLGSLQQHLFSTGALLALGYMGPTIVKSVVLGLLHEPTMLEYEVMIPASAVVLLLVVIATWAIVAAPSRITVTFVKSETEELEQKLLEQEGSGLVNASQIMSIP